MRVFLFLLIILNTYVFATDKSLTEQLAEKSAASTKNMPENVKAIFQKAMQELNNSGIVAAAKKKALMVPKFNVGKTPFKDIYSKKPVVFKFYRGSWCPYCKLEIKNYQKYKSEIEKRGYQVVIVTPDTHKNIHKFKAKNKITYDIFQDRNNEIAKKFGITFTLAPEVVKIYKEFGIDLKSAQGNAANQLPLPGTYVIEKDGKISYSFINVDYTKRLDPLDLIKHLDNK